MKMYECNMKDDSCPPDCLHYGPHKYDDFGKFSCMKMLEYCEHHDCDCICVEVTVEN